MDPSALILELLSRRSADASICPSEVARALADDEMVWRGWMPSVREAAAVLALEGVLVITRGKTSLDPADIGHGAIRLRRGVRFPQS